MRLGTISERFESAGRGPGTISHPGTVDPGGKSYGIYQLSKRVLFDYVQQAPFQFKASLFTSEFDIEWIKTAEKYPGEFALDQHLFTTKRLYLPRIIYARSLGYATWSRRIQEAIFSIAVQHGGAEQIIKDAYQDKDEVFDQISSLYDIRLRYVRSLGLDERLLQALKNRYANEVKAVLETPELNLEYA